MGTAISAGSREFETWSESLDREGGFSIVVQGSLSKANLIDTALHCRHWRALFPAAEIIFSISVTDAVTGSLDESRILRDVELVPAFRHDGLRQRAVREIVQACDRIVLSEGALPMPPIKVGIKTNNINLQIAAARAGMAQASGTYALRVRSDLVFQDRAFLKFYHDNRSLPRRGPAAHRERVMISQLFTLNPFTVERLPFHFSDWFHLGLTEDVRSLWAVDDMSLADAAHYVVHPHAPHSNAYERRLLTRLADEQHIAVQALRRAFPDLALAYCNDPTDAERSMQILLADFMICDLKRCRVLFPKYKKAIADKSNDLSCITYEQWRDLNLRGGQVVFRDHFADQAERGRRHILLRTEPALKPVRLAIAAGRIAARFTARLTLSAWRMAAGRTIGRSATRAGSDPGDRAAGGAADRTASPRAPAGSLQP